MAVEKETLERWAAKGYVDEPIEPGTDLKAGIVSMCREKGAVILAHYYVDGEIQDIADFVGDSLALARKASRTDARMIVMCGVHFMAETCKLLCPDKKVICPDMNAGCSLADSCTAAELRLMKQAHPGHKVVSYVNTTAEVKALTDVVVTSGNALDIVSGMPRDEGIIFCPDYNLGHYIGKKTGRDMILWKGGCHVHERFQASRIARMRKEHPGAIVLAHPECGEQVLEASDVVGSTAALLGYAREHPEREYIVVTEAGILHEMRKACPGTAFHPLPVEGGCNQCEHMKLCTMEKVYNAVKYEFPSVSVPGEVASQAVKPIERMLGMS